MRLRTLPSYNEFDTIKVTNEGGVDSLSIAEAEALVDAKEVFGCKRGWEWFRHTSGGNLKAGGWVGVINVGKAQLTVLPKIDREGGQVDLTKVLIGAGWIDAKFDGRSELLDDSGTDLLSILARLYARELTKEIGRGLPRRYVDRSDDLASLRGRLNIDRQIQLMSSCSAKLACEHDNFEHDTLVNQTLKAALARAIVLISDTKIRTKLRSIYNQLESISDVVVNPGEIDRIVLGRSESRLAPLLSIAKVLLTSRAPHFEGNDRGVKCYGLMFSMWSLFERYALEKLKKEIENTSTEDDKRSVRGQVSDRHLAQVVEEGGTEATKVFKVKPDIIVDRKTGGSGQIILIADTKWKNLEDYEKKKKKTKGIAQEDAYQMYAYSNLYAQESTGPVRVALLYPVIGDEDGTLPGKSTVDEPLAALGLPTDMFLLDPKPDETGKETGIRLDKYNFPLPRRRLPGLPAGSGVITLGGDG